MFGDFCSFWENNFAKNIQMKIACLGWGSLIWRPGGLKIQNKWFEDGPLLPIEFTRISCDKRVTLVIDKKARPVRVLWALMDTNNLQEALNSLKERERVKNEGDIHFLTAEKQNATEGESTIKSIKKWMDLKNLDAVIWTGLSYSKKTNKERPTIAAVIKHLKGLCYNDQKNAEEYIRKAPRQIDTEYRRKIETEFGWTPID